jgi:hypothetical protein
MNKLLTYYQILVYKIFLFQVSELYSFKRVLRLKIK